jgi:hypothetical protein
MPGWKRTGSSPSEIIRHARVIIAAIGIPDRGIGIADDVAVVDQRRLAVGIGRERDIGMRSRMDVEDVVAADRQLQAFGDVVPGFQVRETDIRLAGVVIGQPAIRRRQIVLRPLISFPHR